MPFDKIDRRVRKTRTLLQNSLIRLMEQKDIQDISVKELSEMADINRGTFYLHYSDIYDMLHKMEDELFSEFNTILDRDLTDDNHIADARSVFLDIFTFLEKNRAIACVMLGPHGDLTFMNRLRELVKRRTRHALAASTDLENYDYYAPFIISGCIGVIETWLRHPHPQSPEEMAELCSRLLLKGLSEV